MVRIVSKFGGRRAVLVLGWLYVALAAGLPILHLAELRAPGEVLTTSTIVGGAGLVLLYFGYHLPQSGIRSALYADIARWCVRAVGAALGVFVFIALVGTVDDPVGPLLNLSALATVAGLGIGYWDAKAKTRALDAEDRQREAERYSRELERYRAIVETVDDGIFVLDEENHFLLVNEACTDLVEFTREELVGSHASLVVAEDAETVDERLERDRTTDGPVTYETTLITAAGETVDVEWSAAALPTSNVASRDVVGVVRDVTERNRRKQQLERQNERLESFAGMLTHELRNPVTIGQIYSQQVEIGSNPQAHANVREAFDRIEDTIDIMLLLTRGREALTEQTSVELATAARTAWDKVDAPEATLNVALDGTVDVDDTYICHLFWNLFENAVDHGEDDVTVTVGELSTGFYVADDGVGIPAADREKVFTAGYTTAGGEGGMGIGLTFVREMATLYEWRCSITESATDGAQFEFEDVTPPRGAID